jgi:hypothetical protein
MGLLKYVVAVVLLASSGAGKAAELMPGVVFFDPPPFLVDKGNLNDPLIIKCYIARDNVLGKTTRRLAFTLRAIGFTNAPIGQPAWLHVDQQFLGREILALYKNYAKSYTTNGPGLWVTHLSGVTNTYLGGLPAVQVAYRQVKPDVAPVIYTETYWVQYDTNSVVVVDLVAHSPEALQSLKGCLPAVRIKKKQ